MGCPALVTKTARCPAHAKHGRKHADQALDRRRGSAHSRGYDRAWQRIRGLKLKRNPICEHCKAKGRTTAAKDVDHIVPLPEGTNKMDNLQALCRRCHNVKTAAQRPQQR